jgi:ABC-2 type transport system ATP-binding protein
VTTAIEPTTSLRANPERDAAVNVSRVTHSYGSRVALDEVTFAVAPGEIFALLGPNGGGKTTLFRIISTLLRPANGSVSIFGADVTADPQTARAQMGVVFQSPALDSRLTVVENLLHQGHLYGLGGAELRRRSADVLDRLKLADRARDLVATLSGGLQRRAEIAKALLHRPRLLVLDEPSTGLDPSARRDVWQDVQALRDGEGTTVLLTTHLMDEAAACDRVGILHQGRLVALGEPGTLTAAIGGDVILVSSKSPATLGPKIQARFGVKVEQADGRLRIERERAHEFITDLVEAFPGEIDAVTFGKPTLEDVFVHCTGQNLES